MSDITLLPDAESLVSAYLRTREEVTDLAAQRVFTILPTNKAFPLVRVVRVGGAPLFSRPLYIDVPRVQIDVWADTKKAAWQLAETCRAVMALAHLASHEEGVVSNVALGGLLWQPDTDFKPAKPRYLFDAVLTVRPRSLDGS